jgi:2-methylcitrate dehydratase
MAGDAEKWQPTNRETADHSMPYTAAVALMYGTVEPRHFAPEYWGDPRLLELTQKVQVSVSEEANRRAPEAMLSTVEIVTTSGQRRSAEVAYHRGHYKNPMSDQEIEAKFRALARELLTDRQIDALLECLWNLEQVEDIGEVIRLVRI